MVFVFLRQGHVGGLISSDNMTETYLLQLLVVSLHECHINLELWQGQSWRSNKLEQRVASGQKRASAWIK